MQAESVRAWRRDARNRLLAARMAVDAPTLRAWRVAIDGHLERAFPGLGKGVVAFCWPVENEYDARHFVRRCRARGATSALPVVVAPRAPLEFREWHPGVRLARGPLDIPYPAASPVLAPDSVLLPMNGFDAAGYRLGYGGGFFDRTLAAMEKKPLVIGVTYEFARVDTIHPQAWDVPVDWVVTERGVYRRDPEGLAFLGAPPAGEPGALASPVCYAGEVAPDYFGGDPAR